MKRIVIVFVCLMLAGFFSADVFELDVAHIITRNMQFADCEDIPISWETLEMINKSTELGITYEYEYREAGLTTIPLTDKEMTRILMKKDGSWGFDYDIDYVFTRDQIIDLIREKERNHLSQLAIDAVDSPMLYLVAVEDFNMMADVEDICRIIKHNTEGILVLRHSGMIHPQRLLEPTTQEEITTPLAQFGELTEIPDQSLAPVENGRTFHFFPYEDPPIPITPIKPKYPFFSWLFRVQGTVLLEVQIYKDGAVGDISVLHSVQSGRGGLDRAAIAAVRKTRFVPGKSTGNPVETTITIPVEFKIK